MGNTYYPELDSRISELLNKWSRTFSADEIKDVKDFLDVDEYGLALETFVAIMHNYGFIDIESFREIESLASLMEIDDEDMNMDFLRKAAK